MEQIHHFAEVIRRAVSGGGREVSGYLIAPGAVIGILCQRHKLNVCVRHFFQIGDNLFRKSDVAGKLFLRLVLPGRNICLINVHGAFVGIVLFLF